MSRQLSPNHEKYTFERKGKNALTYYDGTGRQVKGSTQDDSDDEVAPIPPATLQSELEQLRRERSTAVTLLEDSRSQLVDAARNAELLQKEIADLRRETTEKAATEQAQVKAELNAEREYASQLKQEIERLRELLNEAPDKSVLERFHNTISELRADLQHERERFLQYRNDTMNSSTEEVVRLRHALNEVKGQLAREEQRCGELRDQLSLNRTYGEGSEIETSVHVEREGMRSRADLLRKVYESHRLVVNALKHLKITKASDSFMRIKNSVRDQSVPKDIVTHVEAAADDLASTIHNSASVIKSYFTTSEKLACGMSSEWFKPEGKLKPLEEKVITTTVTTVRSPSPSVGFGRISPDILRGSPMNYGGNSRSRSPVLGDRSPAAHASPPKYY